MPMNVDELYMRRCLQLAANGLGRVRPNPLVGCVIVRGGKIVSEGYHQEYGHNHAERNALLRLDSSSSQSGEVSRSDGGVCCGATLYVNLEPCSHYGKTPPCADLIIEKGVKRVVCCNDDPNPLVAGNGFRKLQEAGIEVVRHVLEEEGRELNRRFFTFMEKRRPYVILKWAESADGFMAPNAAGPYWLSTLEQNRLNHRWRTEEAAILVGSETYLQDKPSLTPRHYIGPAPQPVVLDRRGRLVHSSTTAEQRSPSPNFAPLRSQAVSLSEPGRREEPDSFNRDSNSPPKLGGVPRRGEGVCHGKTEECVTEPFWQIQPVYTKR